MVLKLVFNLVAFLINVKQPSDCQVLPDPQLSGATASAVLLWLCVQIISYIFNEQFSGDCGLLQYFCLFKCFKQTCTIIHVSWPFLFRTLVLQFQKANVITSHGCVSVQRSTLPQIPKNTILIVTKGLLTSSDTLPA